MAATGMDQHYESANPLVKYIFHARLREIASMLPSAETCRLLDAGCGGGHLLQVISKSRNTWELWGADVCADSIRSASQRLPDARISVQNLGKLTYEDNFFDVIVCSEVLEHITDYPVAIAELRRVLKPQGQLIVTFPNEPLCKVVRLLSLRNPIVADHVNSFRPMDVIREVALPVVDARNLPFHLHDVFTLIHVLAFKKVVPQ